MATKRILTILLTSTVLCSSIRAVGDDWLAFRGDGSGGVAVGPAKLDNSESGNLAWRASMPGKSVAGPIIVDGQVITTSSAGPDGEKIFVTSLDLKSGTTMWEQSFDATGRPFCHESSANAAPTPASDGNRIVAFFSSNDLVCLNTQGELQWYRGLGFESPKAGNDVGMASSPIIAGDVVVVQVESKGESFAMGIDLQTGVTRWRIDRPKSSNWSSPLLITRGDGSQEVVLQSSESVLAVHPGTGATSWTIDEGRATIPSPTSSGGLLMLPGDDLLVLDLVGSDAASTSDDKDNTPAEAWRSGKFSPRNASVVANEDRVYALKGSVLVGGTLGDGEMRWQERLGSIGSGWATPVIAGKRIYAFDQAGNGVVVEDQGDTAEVVSEVTLDDGVLGSPAIADGRLIIRAKETVYCFE
ncbi:outer membrane biogenesis protein BamB [Rubripirellula tenax]|uniref:Outer membrane biogenesis protein BamB n=1 Tax=Rubripirellula tenax TaxID=2528015 RepID=A0A5C6FB01_9BACT|nr:PQQ-binding-like beta-propeller repeat protein [Rubripirellula tenax]TWU56759.1 outer membrane biogenesis protein BamB [Rubripirellula tenax]